MKKLLLLIAIVCITADLSAQTPIGKFSIKPMAGVNLSNFSNTSVDIYSMKVGLTVGAEFEYGANPWLGLTFGLHYSQQGAKLDGTLDEMVYDGSGDRWLTRTKLNGKLNCNYLNLPLMANIYLPAVKGLALKAGFQVGILASDKMSADGLIVMQNLDYTINDYLTLYDSQKSNQIAGYSLNMSDVCNTIDFGIPVGLSYEYKNIVLDARYFFGLTKIDKTDTPDTARNQHVSITLGYKFHL